MTQTRTPTLTPFRLALAALPVGLAVACTIGGSETVGAGIIDDPSQQGPAAAYALRLTEMGRYAINGDTPTVAWSPDGKRLAVADQVSYFAEPAVPNNDRHVISVIDLQQNETAPDGATRPALRQVYDGFGYHPAWLDDSHLAFGVSTYESDAAMGIWTLELGGRARTERVSNASAYHLRPGTQAGHVVYWAGWPGPDAWIDLDLASGQEQVLSGSTSSWEPPAGAFVDQCPTTAGNLEVGLTYNGGYVSDAANGSSARIQFASAATRGKDDVVTDITPCLSPDGQVAVFFMGDGEYREMLLARIEKVELDPAVEAAKAAYMQAANAGTLQLLAGPEALPGEAQGDYGCFAADAVSAHAFSFSAGDATVYGFEVFWGEPDPELQTPAPFMVHLFDASGLLIGEGQCEHGQRDDVEWTPPWELGVC